MTYHGILPNVRLGPWQICFQFSAGFILLLFIRWIYQRFTRISISYLPGPAKSDWLFGNLTDLNFQEAGTSHFAWQKTFGTAFKIFGVFGQEILMLSDLSALQHVFNNSYKFIRQSQEREYTRMLIGPGLVAVERDEHKRQRKVMNPAFGHVKLKALFPMLKRHSHKLISVMTREVQSSHNGRTTTLNIHDFLSRTLLDMIAEAAFDYQIDSIGNKADPLRDALHSLENDSLVNLTKSTIFFQFSLEYIPAWIIKFLCYLPIKKFSIARVTRDTISRIAGRLVNEKVASHLQGLEGGKDVLTLLVRANAEEEGKARMSNDEVTAQIATITLAAHGTTANTISFGLWELAQRHELQARVRKEILDTQNRIAEEGDSEISLEQCDRMPLLNAFIKETYDSHRVAMEHSVIPLARPVKLSSGQVVTEIPVSKGQKLWLNLAAFNRLPEYFGQDSYDFNIDRWLDGPKDIVSTGFGVYAGLATFGHGPRGCIGWRLSLYEIQILLVDLLSNFEFKLAEGEKPIERVPGMAMMPGLKGDRAAGRLLPLAVSILHH